MIHHHQNLIEIYIKASGCACPTAVSEMTISLVHLPVQTYAYLPILAQ